MIYYNYELDFKLKDQQTISNWIKETIENEGFTFTEIAYVFCDDACLLEKNITYLDHDTLTDIISFDYSVGKNISGDIFISVDRVKENAETYKVSFEKELHRVMIHGILHFCHYKDKTSQEKSVMRAKEDYYLSLLKI